MYVPFWNSVGFVNQNQILFNKTITRLLTLQYKQNTVNTTNSTRTMVTTLCKIKTKTVQRLE